MEKLHFSHVKTRNGHACAVLVLMYELLHTALLFAVLVFGMCMFLTPNLDDGVVFIAHRIGNTVHRKVKKIVVLAKDYESSASTHLMSSEIAE